MAPDAAGAETYAVLGRPFAFHSADGGATFERVTLPTGPQLFGGSSYVEPVAGGFTLVTTRQIDVASPSEVEVLRSIDGRTWDREAGAIPGVQHVAAVGPLGVVIGVDVPDGDGADHRLLSSRDGRLWSSDSVAELTGRDDVRGVSQIVVRGDRVAVSVRTGAPDQEVTGRVAIVGTPR